MASSDDLWRRDGGAARMRMGGKAEVYTVQQDKRARETDQDARNLVVGHLSPKLKLTHKQRVIGTCYAAYSERIMSIGYRVPSSVKVDGSSTGSATDRSQNMIQMVACAHAALAGHRVIYPLGRARGDQAIGRHDPMHHRRIIDLVCIDGDALETVAVRHGWLVERTNSKGKTRAVVPDRQRKLIAETLREGLDMIEKAWNLKGLGIPLEFFSVEIE